MMGSISKFVVVAALAAIASTGFGNVAFAGAESKCKACHTFEQGGKNKNGPNLFGIFDRKAGEVEGYRYSEELKGSGIVWTEENLRQWINDSKALIKTTRMPSQRVEGERADEIIAFMKSNM